MEIIELFRILALVNSLKRNKSYQLTFDKLILLDFCLEHNKLMIEGNEDNWDFDSINSYFHLQPSRESYYKRVNILTAKGLLKRDINKNQYSFSITEFGENFCSGFDNETFNKMLNNAELVLKMYKGMSMTDLQNIMYDRTKDALLK